MLFFSKKDLRGKDLRGKDLRGKDLRGKDLRGKDLRGKDLRGKGGVSEEAKHLTLLRDHTKEGFSFMKKWMIVLAALLLACLLPVCAMAQEVKVYDLSEVGKPGFSDANVTFWGDNKEEVRFAVQGPVKLTGKLDEKFKILSLDVRGNDTVTLQDVTGNDVFLSISDYSDWMPPAGSSEPLIIRSLNSAPSLTLILEGKNSFSSSDGSPFPVALASRIPLTITGSGSLDCIAKGQNRIGIQSNAGLTIESGIVTAKGSIGIASINTPVAVKGGTLTAESNGSSAGFESAVVASSMTNGGALLTNPVVIGSKPMYIKAGQSAAAAVQLGSITEYTNQCYLHITDVQPAAPIAPAVSHPSTGDNANLALWGALLLLSAVTLLGVARKARKA